MLRNTASLLHRGGKSRGYVLKDMSLKVMNSSNGIKPLRRAGAVPFVGQGPRRAGRPEATEQYAHAWPLLSHDDLGYSDQAAQTHLIQLASYMPKRNKGLAPWFRGADTYSPAYSEQGRYEYQRYLMISRFPSDYRKHFRRFLGMMNGTRNRTSPRSPVLPQEALHWLLRMIIDNFNPQHVHYVACMEALMSNGELDMARDVWKIMERQQTIPDDKCIASYLDLCMKAKEKEWALECWNRYCTEKRFLEPGEIDPKPIGRTPFTLTREETLYLPKWKKHFDHDPNLDVPDLNRFNTTRTIYLRMAKVMLVTGELALFDKLFDTLESKLLTTPTPVPEPPQPHMSGRPKWAPNERAETLHASAWRVAEGERVSAMAPPTSEINQMHQRYDTNQQFLVRSVAEVLEALSLHKPNVAGGSGGGIGEKAHELVAFGEKLVDRLFAKLGKSIASMETHQLLANLLRFRRVVAKHSGAQLHKGMSDFLKRKAAAAAAGAEEAGAAPAPAAVEMAHPCCYREVLEAFADAGECDANTKQPPAGFNPKETMAQAAEVIREMSTPSFVWAADIHLPIVRCLVNCGTMAANAYFVNNVLRQVEWDGRFLESLYLEYRREADVEKWAELTKRALVWTARYNVAVTEKFKRLVEEDYDTIRVQVRTLKELAVFQFKDTEEKRLARNPAAQLSNPWMDYVSHALPFPDRDTGYPNEYGDIGQWRSPDAARGTKGPGYYSPALYGEEHRGYTAEWRDPKDPLKGMPTAPTPWGDRVKQYKRGNHPSYDMIYAGPFPEIFPNRIKFRQPTRWDFHDIQKQSKYKVSGPW